LSKKHKGKQVSSGHQQTPSAAQTSCQFTPAATDAVTDNSEVPLHGNTFAFRSFATVLREGGAVMKRRRQCSQTLMSATDADVKSAVPI
jgi:hypothetical protein